MAQLQWSKIIFGGGGARDEACEKKEHPHQRFKKRGGCVQSVAQEMMCRRKGERIPLNVDIT